MYLSIIRKVRDYKSMDEKILDAKKLAKKRRKYGDFRNEQNIHRMICDMAGGCKRETQNLLYIKIGNDANMFYIQSDCMLNDRVVRECGYEIIEVKNEGDFLKSVNNGNRIILRAKLAPVERNCATRAQHSLADNDEKRAIWLERLSERCGFRFLNAPEEGAMDHITWMKTGRGSSWTNAFYYASEIEIIDKDRFIQAVETGVGKYKAYGCGMLMVG